MSATAAGKTVCTVKEASDARRRILPVCRLAQEVPSEVVWIREAGTQQTFCVISKASLLDHNSNAGSRYLGTLNQVYAVIPEIYQSPEGSKTPVCRQSPMPPTC